MIEDAIERMKWLAEDLEECLNMPVDFIAKEDTGHVTIKCGGEIIIDDSVEYAEGTLEDMISGMLFYKKIKEDKKNG